MAGKIFIISGYSGSGKTTVSEEMLKIRNNTIKAISFTTRPQRPNEKDGIDYFFIDKMKFLKLVETGNFIEFSEVYGNLYGTSFESFKAIESNKDVVKVIDVQGVEKLRNLNLKACFIFFDVPVEIIKERLEARKEQDISRRLKEYEEETKYKKYFDHFLDTSGTEKDIPKEVEQLMNIMDAYKN